MQLGAKEEESLEPLIQFQLKDTINFRLLFQAKEEFLKELKRKRQISLIIESTF